MLVFKAKIKQLLNLKYNYNLTAFIKFKIHS